MNRDAWGSGHTNSRWNFGTAMSPRRSRFTKPSTG